EADRHLQRAAEIRPRRLGAYRRGGQPAGGEQISILDQPGENEDARRIRRGRDRDQGKLVARLGRLAPHDRFDRGCGAARAGAGQGQTRRARGRARELRKGKIACRSTPVPSAKEHPFLCPREGEVLVWTPALTEHKSSAAPSSGNRTGRFAP